VLVKLVKTPISGLSLSSFMSHGISFQKTPLYMAIGTKNRNL